MVNCHLRFKKVAQNLDFSMGFGGSQHLPVPHPLGFMSECLDPTGLGSRKIGRMIWRSPENGGISLKRTGNTYFSNSFVYGNFAGHFFFETFYVLFVCIKKGMSHMYCDPLS